MSSATPLTDTPLHDPIPDSIAEGKDVLTRSLSAGRWSLADTILQNVLAYGTFLITARLLSPGDFGIISIVVIVPNLIDALTALSFDNALVQKRAGDEVPYLNVSWTFSVIRGSVIFALAFVLAPILAPVFHAEHYLFLFQLSGILLFIQTFSNIGQIYFFKTLDFRRVFWRDCTMALTQTLVTIGAVLLLRSYWGLFIGDIASSIAVVVATFLLATYHPRFDWHFGKLRDLLPYSQWIYGQGMLGQLARTIEDSSVARFASATDVGLFTKTKGLAFAPVSPIVSLINTIGFSAYSRMQDSLDHVREGFNKSFEILIFVGIPFLGAVYLAGHRILIIMLGDVWGSSSVYLQILATAAVIDVVTVTLIGPLFNALNRPKRQFIAQVVYLITLSILVVLLVPTYHAYGAAFAMLGASTVSGIYSTLALHDLIRLHVRRVFEAIIVCVLAVVLPVIPGAFLLRFPMANSTLGFVAIGCGIGLSYLALVWLAGLRGRGPMPTIRIVLRSARL